MGAAFYGIMEVFIIGIVGYLVIAGFSRSPAFLDFLTKIVIRITLPCLVFSTMTQRFNPSHAEYWWVFPLLSIAITSVGALLSRVYMAFDRSIKYRGEFMALVSFQNGIFLPLAFAPVLFDSEQLPQFLNLLFLFNLLNIPTFFSLGVWMVNSSAGIGFRLKDALSPPIVTTLVSFILAFTGCSHHVPVWILKPAEMLGALTAPLSMLFVGGIIILNLPKTGTKDWAEPIKITILKCLVLPLIATGLVLVLKPSVSIALFLILQSVMPSASLIALVAPPEGNSQKIIAGALLLTSILSIITIPLFMGIYGVLYR
jgi:predicted permease